MEIKYRDIETYDKEITEQIKEFSELIEPSEKVANFATRLFSIIGNMQGQLEFIKSKRSSNK